MVNTQTGEKIAEPDLQAPISSTPVTVGKLVIVATDDGKIYALDTANNQASLIASLKTTKDKAEQVNAPLSASEGVVYIHTQTKQYETVYALNPETKEILWSIPLASQ